MIRFPLFPVRKIKVVGERGTAQIDLICAIDTKLGSTEILKHDLGLDKNIYVLGSAQNLYFPLLCRRKDVDKLEIEALRENKNEILLHSDFEYLVERSWTWNKKKMATHLTFLQIN